MGIDINKGFGINLTEKEYGELMKISAIYKKTHNHTFEQDLGNIKAKIYPKTKNGRYDHYPDEWFYDFFDLQEDYKECQVGLFTISSIIPSFCTKEKFIEELNKYKILDTSGNLKVVFDFLEQVVNTNREFSYFERTCY
jgi:hypothetical protein